MAIDHCVLCPLIFIPINNLVHQPLQLLGLLACLLDNYFSLGHDKRLYTKLLNDEDIEKQEDYVECDRDDYLGKGQYFVDDLSSS